MKLQTFLSPQDADRVRAAVQAAERRTSAEFKVVVTRHCWGKLQEKAERVFVKQNLHCTPQRNGVLILVVAANHEFGIFGDKGVNDRVSAGFWSDVRDTMQDGFRAGQMADGLCAGIERLGTQLSELFPPQPDDLNGIPDEVAIDE